MLKGTAPQFATAARDRVFSSRQAPLRSSEIPAINVYVDSETIDDVSASSAPRELKRTMVLAVEGWVASSSAVDDALDALALEIETALDAAVPAGASDLVLSSSEIGLKVDGAQPLGCVHLEFEVTYYTDPRLTAPVDDFATADVRYSLAGDQAPADQAHDLVEIPP